ncbi:MAG: ATP-binding protein [Bacteroidales bacterium]
MKAFHTIAVPHPDILEGRLTMDVFAADLWEAYHHHGPAEYKDAVTFFQKTYLTEGLQNLLNVIQKRIEGKGGDPTIQIQTPFGGGKTHSLIAIMHRAKEWNAKRVVIVGTNLSATDTLWSILEKQLTGKNEQLTGMTAPGKDKLKALLENAQPLVILMDELLEYVTKAAGIRVEQSTLAAQTMAFMQELTETVSVLEKTCLVVTLPSSLMEHYDQSAEQLFAQLQKVMGRVEKIYTPVQESEIAKVIRRRLFSSVDVKKAETVVKGFLDYAGKEGILPPGMEPSEYRGRCMDAYPFLPEVIDVLYHRWGSFPNFQRTRGVLRLLSLVVAMVKDKNIPYITLADLDLAHQEIRQELLKHIGTEYNSVIAQDITDADAGSRKVDMKLGDAYKGLQLATRAATTIFMYSFSGGTEKGATLAEIKRAATTLNNPSSVVAEAVEQLKGRLFFFQLHGEKYFFSNQPNINRIILTKMENIKEEDVLAMEKELLKQSIHGGKFKCFIWEEDASSIPDTEELKLVILPSEKKEIIKNILKTKGVNARVNCNTLFFLFPVESERTSFHTQLKRYKAIQLVENDTTLPLSDEQRKDIKNDLKRKESDLKDAVRRFYRYLAIPVKNDYRKEDLGIPTHGEDKSIDQEIYTILRSNGEILEQIVPLVIKERFLANNPFVLTRQILQSGYRTPGEPRITDTSILQKAMAEGIGKGVFGLGELEGDKPVCRYFKESAPVGFSESEILIREDICREQKAREKETGSVPMNAANFAGKSEQIVVTEPNPDGYTATSDENYLNQVHFAFEIPKGKVNDVSRMINYLQTTFESLSVEIKATKGKISKQDYENKVKETLRQLGINIE